MKILIVEDEPNVSRVIERCLRHTYDIEKAFDGAEGFFLAQEGIYDLIVLDIMLPRMDGFTVLERLREKGITTPVLMLTALGATDDKIKGFRYGADDYLTKPFNRDELLLRVEAILRRSLKATDCKEIVFKSLSLKPSHKRAYIDSHLVELRGRQYDVLEHLVTRQGELITKKQLFDKCWGFMSDTSSNVVEVYVSAVRKQLKAFGYDQYLTTIRGAGYIFGEDSDE